jgi:hypothetical protein
MVHCYEGKYFIEYSDFVDLINCGGWVLRKRMKDNWNAMNHLDYLCGLHHSGANLSVNYVIDNSSLKYARKIDVYIISMNNDPDNPSSPKHIQFVNYHPIE